MFRAHHAVSTVFALLLALPLTAAAQTFDDRGPWWAAAGLGLGSVESGLSAPGGSRDGVAAQFEVGYRLRPTFGVGLEVGTLIPATGCRQWQCGDHASDFAPAFNHLLAFGTFQPRDSGWSLRAGVGVTRFCYQRHWSSNAWSWLDTLALVFDDDYLLDSPGGSGAWRCDASQQALGGSLSVGYDWRVHRNAPVAMGVRLSAEAANFDRNAAIDLPAFRHRALMLTLHLRVN